MTSGGFPPGELHEMRIGIWGATGSGKTTYFGALKLAADQTDKSGTSWAVVGADDVSTALLGENAGILANDKKFPQGTIANTPLKLNLLGERHPRPQRRAPVHGRRLPTAGTVRVAYGLELLDMSGRMVDDATLLNTEVDDAEELDDLAFDLTDPEEPSGAEADLEEVLRHLTDCEGILYLFDPVRDEMNGDAFRYFNIVMGQIEARTLRAGRMLGPKLPHHVAVCITKFDDRQVLAKALGPERLEKLQGSSSPLQVDSETARAYFAQLARERPDGTARSVRDALRSRVLEERLKYFAMSSIGVWWGPGERFDSDDFGNVLDDGAGQTIRGSIRPMNVLEPMVWLASCIRRARRDGLQT